MADTDWIEYKCKSGETLFIYNKVTGEHKWPNDGSLGSSSVMLGQPVIYKEICTTGTQTDDNVCVNGCTSMYINLDHIQNNTETSPRKPDLDKVGDDLHIEPGPGSILDDDGATCEHWEKKYLDKIDKVLKETHGENMDGENSDTANNYPFNAFIESEFQEGGRDDTKYLDCNIATGGSVQDNLNNNRDISVFDNSLSLSVESEIQERIPFDGEQHLMPDIHQYNINQVQRKSNKDLEIPCSEYCQKKKAFGHSYCNKTFKFKSLLQVDLKKHPGDKPFECSKCNRKFARKYDLKSHLIIHTNEMPFECSSCKKQFKHKKSLRRHVIIHTGEKPFECSYEHCRKKFRWNDGLQAHLKTHLRKTVFNCTFCKRTFEKKTASHGNKSFKCSYCRRTINSNLKRGNSDKTSDCVDIKNVCNDVELILQEGHRNDTRQFVELSIDENSKATDNFEQDNLKVKSLLDTSFCNDVENAMQIRNGCAMSETNKNVQSLQSTKHRHAKKSFECSYCKKTYKFSSLLQNHLKKHTGEKPFECYKCNRKFARKYDLKSHFVTHTNERPFECSSCKQQFKCRRSLRKHLKTHTGEKPFECSYCKKTFVRKDGLTVHLKIHLRKK